MDPNNPQGGFDAHQLVAPLLNVLTAGTYQNFHDQGLRRQQTAVVMQAQREQLARASQQAMERHAAVQRAMTNPSPQAYRDLIALDPDHATAIKANIDSLDEEHRNIELRHATAVSNYLEAGLPDKAVEELTRRREADKNAGLPTDHDQSLIDLIQSGPDGLTKARIAIGTTLAAATGADKFATTLKTVGDERRDNAKLPGDIAKQGADLAKTQAETGAIPTETALKQAQADEAAARADQIRNPLPETASAGIGMDGRPIFYNKNAPPPENSTPAGPTANNAGLGTFVDQLIGSESGGRATAANPNSSAVGAGQFIKGTWLPLISELHPELTQGKSEEQILALRNDPKLSREATSAYAQQNADTLGNAGLPVNRATLAMAHKLGPGDAQTVLRARPETPLAQILPAPVMAANPQLRGKTAGQYATGLISEFGTSPIDVAPGDPNGQGEDFLRTLPPQRAALIRSIANGDTPMPSMNRASAANLLLNQQVQQYDPTASAVTIDTRRKTREDYTKGKSGQSVKAATTVTGHLLDLEKAITDLHNTQIPTINHIGQATGGAVGLADTQRAVAKFNSLKATMAMELTSFYRGTGGAEADVKAFMDQLKPDASPISLHATVQSIATAMQSRMDALRQGYESGMAGANTPFPLRPGTEAALDRLAGGTATAAPQVLVNAAGQRIQLDPVTNTWKPVP